MLSREEAVERLLGDGLLRCEEDRLRTARRWQRAMARAAVSLLEAGDPGEDLRVPVAFAMVELYGTSCSDQELALLVETMTPLESAELTPRTSHQRA